jgi:hypothetical protein
MNSVNDAIVHVLTRSQALLQRFTADLQPQEYLHRTTPQANCAAWTIGHLVLTDRRTLGRLGVVDLPPLPDGFEKRFGRESGAPQACDFGDVGVLMPLFNQHRAMLIDAVKRASIEQLNHPLEHQMFSTAGEMASFMGLHTAMHAGQLTIIRRSLGRPPIV